MGVFYTLAVACIPFFLFTYRNKVKSKKAWLSFMFLWSEYLGTRTGMQEGRNNSDISIMSLSEIFFSILWNSNQKTTG